MRGGRLDRDRDRDQTRPENQQALHVTALVERTARIAWGVKALGGLVPIPGDVNTNFAAVYTYLRINSPPQLLRACESAQDTPWILRVIRTVV